MREPDWSLYQAFLTVMDAGGLTRAARASGVSQPTLSRQIAALEQALGLVLFDRAGRGLTPSPVAHRVADRARKMRAAAAEILVAQAGDAQGPSGTVRITASEIVACYALPPVLADLSRTHPQIQIELVAANEVSNLLEREADIAVRMTKPAQAGLIARRMPDVQVGFYMAKDYAASAGTPQGIEDLTSMRLIGYDKSNLILSGARRAKIPLSREDFAFRCDHQVACWQMARVGLGVAMLARFVGDADPAMIRVLPKFPAPPMQMWLAARREVKTVPRLRAVFDALASGLKRL